MIFEVIPRLSVYDVRRISRVSRGWRNMIFTLPLHPWGRVNAVFLSLFPHSAFLPHMVLDGTEGSYESVCEWVLSHSPRKVCLEAPLNDLFFRYSQVLSSLIPEFEITIVPSLPISKLRTSKWQGLRTSWSRHSDNRNTKPSFHFSWDSPCCSGQELQALKRGQEEVLGLLQTLKPVHVSIHNESLVPLIAQIPSITSIAITHFTAPRLLLNLSECPNIREVRCSRHLSDLGPHDWNYLSVDIPGSPNITTLKLLVAPDDVQEAERLYPNVREFWIMHQDHEPRDVQSAILAFRERRSLGNAKQRTRYYHMTQHYSDVSSPLGCLPLVLLRRIFGYLTISDLVRACQALGSWNKVSGIGGGSDKEVLVPMNIFTVFPTVRLVYRKILCPGMDGISERPDILLRSGGHFVLPYSQTTLDLIPPLLRRESKYSGLNVQLSLHDDKPFREMKSKRRYITSQPYTPQVHIAITNDTLIAHFSHDKPEIAHKFQEGTTGLFRITKISLH